MGPVRSSVFATVGAVVALAVLAVGCGSSDPTAGSGAATASSSVDPSRSPSTAAEAGTTAPTTTAAATVIDPAVGVATAPVTPSYQPTSSTFEGFAVNAYVPEHPVGVVYLFHGTGGSATFSTKLETVDVLNELVARGYGFVATESTDRKAAQWDIDDASMDTNADLARLARLRQSTIDTTAVDPDTPTYGIGMSNGSAFVSLWAAASVKAGLPVSAIGMYMAPVTKATTSIGGVPVPTFMVTGATDSITNPTNEKRTLDAIAAAGIPTEYHQVPERNVVAARYLRIPGVDQTTADGIVAALQDAGWIDASGRLLVDTKSIGDADESKAASRGIHLPAAVTPAQALDVSAETKATIGQHQFNAELKVANADFFDAHR